MHFTSAAVAALVTPVWASAFDHAGSDRQRHRAGTDDGRRQMEDRVFHALKQAGIDAATFPQDAFTNKSIRREFLEAMDKDKRLEFFEFFKASGSRDRHEAHKSVRRVRVEPDEGELDEEEEDIDIGILTTAATEQSGIVHRRVDGDTECAAEADLVLTSAVMDWPGGTYYTAYSNTVNVQEGFHWQDCEIEDVDLAVTVDHAWYGTHSASITHESTSTTVQLIESQYCYYDCHNVFDDEEGNVLDHHFFPQSRPGDALDAFHGMDPTGDWTLEVYVENSWCGGRAQWSLAINCKGPPEPKENTGKGPPGGSGPPGQNRALADGNEVKSLRETSKEDNKDVGRILNMHGFSRKPEPDEDAWSFLREQLDLN